MPKPSCEICGQPFKARTSKGIRQRTCSRACGVELRRRIHGTAGHPLAGESTTVPWRDCQGCDAPFISSSRRYCLTCRQTKGFYYWLGRRAERLKPFTPRICRICSETFTPARPDRQGNAAQSVYCSTSCRDEGDRRDHNEHSRKRRSRKRTNGQYENFTLEEIATRDGWRCHICQHKVNRSNWSVDHLIPIVYGGEHTRANVALAHHLCNSKRGAGRIPAQLLLLG